MRRAWVLVFGAVGAAAAGCEPEIGGLCDNVASEVEAAIEVNEGTNNLVQDVTLDNCTQAFCVSTNGSRPYCTKKCEADIECAEAGAGFTCQKVIAFGPLACADFEDPAGPRPGADHSEEACESDADCTVALEICFLNADTAGNLVNKCGVGGRDCLTGEDGGESPKPLKYCADDPNDEIEAIVERDKQFRPNG